MENKLKSEFISTDLIKLKCKKCGFIVDTPYVKCPKCFSSGTMELISSIQVLLPEPIAVFKKEYIKLDIGFSNINKFYGEAIPKGNLSFIVGDSGIGKSTFEFQIGAYLQSKGFRVFWFTGEETPDLVTARAERIGIISNLLKMFFNKDLREFLEIVRIEQPDVVIIDSIQALAGSQIRGLSNEALKSAMLQIRKMTYAYGITTFVIGQVNKDLTFSGPKALSHYCDIMFEAKRGNNDEVIITTPTKNRFGPTNLRAIFRMTDKGLIEIDEQETSPISRHIKPSAIGIAAFITKMQNGLTADEVTITSNEKDKLLLVGGANNHAAFLTTVIQHYFEDFQPTCIARANLSEKLNKSADLAIVVAVLSFFYKKPVPQDMAFISSVDGTGRLLPTPDMAMMVNRAKEQGYIKIFGAMPIGSQITTWETADNIQEVWKQIVTN
jgi:DNA repair protein RadA/Sms